jgi:tetratricopeptide (TPR) repeat protein
LAKRLTVEYPKYVVGYAILADISLRKREFKQAVAYAEHAVSITPLAGGYSVLTASYYELGKYQKALDAYRIGMKQENIQFIVRGDAIVAAAYAAAHLGLFPESAEIVRIRLAALPESENNPAIQKLIGHLKQKGAW